VGVGLVPWVGGPPGAICFFSKRFQSQINTEKDIIQGVVGTIYATVTVEQQ